MTPSAAIAEKDLAQRQRTLWPPHLTAIDADWLPNQTVILEAPRRYHSITPIEWKSRLAGPQDLNNWQFTVFRRSINQACTAFAGIFTHSPLPWAFKLYPVLSIAGDLLEDRPLLLTERQLTEFLTVMSGTASLHGLEYFDQFRANYKLRKPQVPNMRRERCVRCGEDVAAQKGWLADRKDREQVVVVHRNDCGAGGGLVGAETDDFFAHLDDKLPPRDVWPEVVPVREYERYEPTFNFRTARRWLMEHTDHFDRSSGASVTPLIPTKKTIGALRRQQVEDREEIQAKFEATQRQTWSRERAPAAPLWAKEITTAGIPGPFGGRTDVDLTGVPATTRAAPTAPRPTGIREPAQVGELHPLPFTLGVRSCGIAGCVKVTAEVDARGAICPDHQDPASSDLYGVPGVDHELRPHESGSGWACPVCVHSAKVFFGSKPHRRCRECFARWPTAETAVARLYLQGRGG